MDAIYDEILTMEEAAAILKMKPRQVYELTRRVRKNGWTPVPRILDSLQGETHQEVRPDGGLTSQQGGTDR